MGYKDKEKQAAYQREWYAKQDKAERTRSQREARMKLRNIVDTYKVERGCARCKYNNHPAAIDAHHYKGDKNFMISFAVQNRLSIDVIIAELEKCELLYANCHRIEHAAQRTPS